MYSVAPRRPRKHLPRTARDFIIPPFLCLVLPAAQRRATENCESSTFVVVCCPYTKIMGKGEMVFPCLPHLPPPLFLTQEEGTCTEWTAHNCLSCTDHSRLTPFKQRAGKQGVKKKCSPQIFILLDSPCVIKMNTLLQQQ